MGVEYTAILVKIHPGQDRQREKRMHVFGQILMTAKIHTDCAVKLEELPEKDGRFYVYCFYENPAVAKFKDAYGNPLVGYEVEEATSFSIDPDLRDEWPPTNLLFFAALRKLRARDRIRMRVVLYAE